MNETPEEKTLRKEVMESRPDLFIRVDKNGTPSQRGEFWRLRTADDPPPGTKRPFVEAIRRLLFPAPVCSASPQSGVPVSALRISIAPTRLLKRFRAGS
jgi:hypothetical protein